MLINGMINVYVELPTINFTDTQWFLMCVKDHIPELGSHILCLNKGLHIQLHHIWSDLMFCLHTIWCLKRQGQQNFSHGINKIITQFMPKNQAH